MPTKALVQAVNRNRSRFPPDFMFQLTAAEFEVLRSQFVTSNDRSSGGRRYRPYAFTEQGVAMLSSVLRSRRAIASNIQIMRAFVRLRRLVMAQAELVGKLNVLEQKYDARFKVVFNVIRKLMAPPIARASPSAFSAAVQLGFEDHLEVVGTHLSHARHGVARPEESVGSPDRRAGLRFKS